MSRTLPLESVSLILLLCCAAQISLAGFFDGGYSGSTVNRNEWDVECGTGLCSRDDPLCCGFNGEEYCIPGGQKCCAGIQPGRTNIASCGIDQDCCQAGPERGFAIECCNRTQSCLGGLCVDDPCSNTTNQEYCLASPQCQWCCAENRCMLKGVSGPNSFEAPTCGSFQVIDSDVYTSYTNPETGKTYSRYADLPQFRTGPAEPQCNKCNLQKTCGDCIRAGNYSSNTAAGGGGGDGGYTKGGCTWCAQTQSCWPAEVIQDSGFCQNRQYAGTPEQCEDIGPTGRGLHIQVSGDNDFGPIILGTFCFTILAIFFLACFRYIMFRRRLREWQAMMDPSLDIASSKGPKRPIVKRYGFKAEEKKEEDSKKDSSKKPEESSDKKDDEKKKNGGEEASSTIDDDPRALCPSEVEVISEGLIKCMACGKAVILPTPKTEAPPVPPPATEEEKQDDEEDGEEDREDEDGESTGGEEDGEEASLLAAERKKKPKKKASNKKKKEEPMIGMADANRVDADELLGGENSDSRHSDEDRPQPGSSSGRDEGPEEMLIVLPCYHHICVACGRTAVAEQQQRKKEKLEEMHRKRKEMEEAEGKKKGNKKSANKNKESSTDVDGSPPPINSDAPTTSSASTTTNAAPPIAASSPTDSGPVTSLNEATTRVIVDQEKKKEEEALTAAILDEVPLYCPRCGNTVECCIVPSKIIQN